MRKNLSKKKDTKRSKYQSPSNYSLISDPYKRKSHKNYPVRQPVRPCRMLTRNAETHSMASLSSISKQKFQSEITEYSEKISARQSLQIGLSKVKRSDATTQGTDNFCSNSRDDMPFETFSGPFRQTSSLMMENEGDLRQVKSNFYLGSLDPVPEYEPQNSIEGE